MFNAPSRKGFSILPKVSFNLSKEKMSAPNNAYYVLTQAHAGLPNSVLFSAEFDTAFASKDTDDLGEGSTNFYFTDERVDDRVYNLLIGGTGITLTYDDVANTLTIARDAIDISTDTNLSASSPITLTGDDLGFDFSTINTWTSTNTFVEQLNLVPETNQILINRTSGKDTLLNFPAPFIGNKTLTFPNTTSTIPGTNQIITWTAAHAHDANVTYNNEVDGSFHYIAGGGYGNQISGSRYFKTYNGADFTATKGYPMPTNGSLTKLSVGCNCSIANAGANWDIEVRINGTAVASLTVTLDTSSTGDKSGYESTARNTVGATFSAGDIISFYGTLTGIASIQDIMVNVYGHFDA